jgi:hypothetical protein
LAIATSPARSLGFAALTLDRKNAVLFTCMMWLANEACGFSILLSRDREQPCLGAVLGLAAVAATLSARLAAFPPLHAALAFVIQSPRAQTVRPSAAACDFLPEGC